MPSFTVILLLATVVTTVLSQSPFYSNYPQYQQYAQAQQVGSYYSNPRSYDRYSNPNTYHRTNVWGGDPSLGWAQVPRYFSPQFSPVYGGK